uniref:Lysophospholipase n=1 Tax=uncultured Thiotrichaceae bacterium TaxID=298394 RepID=A0A6S6SE64_9GAMM|nr:MAG: Lysophospholipase [uncultured Thiotrichaceae bacterium]
MALGRTGAGLSKEPNCLVYTVEMNKILIPLTLVLLVLLAVSMVANYTLYKKAFLPLYATKQDPLELRYYPVSENPANNGKPIFLLYGDSRSLSWPAPELGGYQVINRGIGNQSSTQVAMRFGLHAESLMPDTILIQVCVNDLKTIPLFPEQREQIIHDCKSNIDEMIADAAAIDATVLLTTVFPLGDIPIERRLFGFDERAIIPAIDEVNEHIKGIEAEHVRIFDTYELLKGEGRKINPDYSRDWLHLNEQGYQRLNQALVEFVKG